MDKKLKLEIFLKKSTLRKDVWNNLDGVKTAAEISKELKKHRSAISRVLLDMKKEDLVTCVNPKDSSFRCYSKNV